MHYCPPLQDEMENYGLVTVLCCETVLVPRRPRSLLLLVFQEPHQPKPHVHFFQCDQIGVRSTTGEGWLTQIPGFLLPCGVPSC